MSALNGWKKISDQLPALELKVLIIVDGEIHIGERWYDWDIDNQCDSWKWYIREYFGEISPTHWHYLPSMVEII